MRTEWERALERWQGAELIDAAAAERIRAFEAQGAGAPKLRWPAIVALVFGAAMLGAGVLLFVAAHWDTLSPGERFALVLGMVAVFHGLGAWASGGSPNLSIALHGVGTLSLGAAIFLTGQIFNLQAHWPSGVMLWAAGAWLGWALRRDWVQFALAALLTPFWLAGEWAEAFPKETAIAIRVLLEGLLLLSSTYFAASTRDRDDMTRQALVWIGGLAMLPLAVCLALEFEFTRGAGEGAWGGLEVAGQALAIALPLGLAYYLRKNDAWINLVAVVWVFGLGLIAVRENIGLYLWCVAGAAAMVAWGVKEGRGERVNMGMAGFALTLLFFYFSQVMDKMGRSASLIGLGLVFLGGGWGIEKMRRRLIARARSAA